MKTSACITASEGHNKLLVSQIQSSAPVRDIIREDSTETWRAQDLQFKPLHGSQSFSLCGGLHQTIAPHLLSTHTTSSKNISLSGPPLPSRIPVCYEASSICQLNFDSPSTTTSSGTQEPADMLMSSNAFPTIDGMPHWNNAVNHCLGIIITPVPAFT